MFDTAQAPPRRERLVVEPRPDVQGLAIVAAKREIECLLREWRFGKQAFQLLFEMVVIGHRADPGAEQHDLCVRIGKLRVRTVLAAGRCGQGVTPKKLIGLGPAGENRVGWVQTADRSRRPPKDLGDQTHL